MEIRAKKIKENAVLPTYAHHNDAGADLYASEEVTILPGVRTVVPTGIALAIPDGYVGLVWDKSGLATKHGITTIAGVIDSGYRGEIMVAVTNISDVVYTVKAGDKIAQLLIQQISQAEFTQTDILDESMRGDGGFGSTGK
jgi:dUTP pyrophosphatase